MKYILENDRFRVVLESMGAEIKSVWDKEQGLEHMWSGDPAYWGKTSPFLFPFIGKLEKERFIHEGKMYPADKHGFGQRVEYEAAEQTREAICFRFRDTEATRAIYPFSFVLEIAYMLQEDGIREEWRVKNTGKGPCTSPWEVMPHSPARPRKRGKAAAGWASGSNSTVWIPMGNCTASGSTTKVSSRRNCFPYCRKTAVLPLQRNCLPGTP